MARPRSSKDLVDDRTDHMSDAALSCRASRQHPVEGFVVALKRELQKDPKIRNLTQLELHRPCLNGCGVEVVEEVNLRTGERVYRRLDYTGARDHNGDNTYLIPHKKGEITGRLHSDDVRLAAIVRVLG